MFLHHGFCQKQMEHYPTEAHCDMQTIQLCCVVISVCYVWHRLRERKNRWDLINTSGKLNAYVMFKSVLYYFLQSILILLWKSKIHRQPCGTTSTVMEIYLEASPFQLTLFLIHFLKWKNIYYE